MVDEIKRFFHVLLIFELLVIILITIPGLVFYALVSMLGVWGYLIATMATVPWLAAWADLISRRSR